MLLRAANPMLVRLTAVAMIAAGVAGCAVSPFTVTRPYPMSGNAVNPKPAPDYHVVCGTGYGIGGPMGFPERISHCRQEFGVPAYREVIRVRG